MNHQTILFDLDGTLTDPAEGITNSVAYALAKFGFAVRDNRTLTLFIGPPLSESFANYYGLSDEKARLAVDYYREYFVHKGIFENKVYPGVASMLSSLKDAGKTVSLATTKPTVYAEQILSHFGLREYFDFVAGSNMDGSRSNKGEIIPYALGSLGKQAQTAVMVGDREHDIWGAKQAKTGSIGVLYGYGSREELENAGADRIVQTVEELRECLIGR